MDKTRHALGPLFSNRTTGYYIFKVAKITIFYQVKNISAFKISYNLEKLNKHQKIKHICVFVSLIGMLGLF